MTAIREGRLLFAHAIARRRAGSPVLVVETRVDRTVRFGHGEYQLEN
jgi:hypothetical protein